MCALQQFQKVLQKEEKYEEEKYEENKTNFEGAYLGNSLADSAQNWNWRCPPRGNSHRKSRVLLLREC